MRRTPCASPCFVLIAVSGVILMALLLLQNAYRSAWRDALRMQEAGHFKYVVVALHYYHDANGVLPPATSGTPPMSWRVAILPYVEQQALFASYQQNQSWNSPANDAACKVRVSSYHAPELKRSNATFTNIVMPTGPGTIGEQSVSLDEITDDHNETIALLALKPSNIPWHEPRDLAISEITRAPADPKRILIKGQLFRGGWCAMVSGSVEWLPPDLDYDTFIAMLTVSGGEKIDMSWRER